MTIIEFKVMVLMTKSDVTSLLSLAIKSQPAKFGYQTLNHICTVHHIEVCNLEIIRG